MNKPTGKPKSLPIRKGRRVKTGMGDQPFYFSARPRGSYHAPRWSEKYESVSVNELVKRLLDDVAELISRTDYEVADAVNTPLTYENRLRSVIHPDVVEAIKLDLVQRIWTEKRGMDEYNAGIPAFLARERAAAVKQLAYLGFKIAQHLEHLTDAYPEVVQSIAATRQLWPVNLGLDGKQSKGRQSRVLKRVKFAKAYLLKLGVGSCPDYLHDEVSIALTESPFKRAATAIFNEMVSWRNPAFLRLDTAWVRRLRALKMPMTRKNSADWWHVVREYLHERWDVEPKQFGPLIKHLGLKLCTKTPYPSTIKRRVIDNDLKDAFLALARAVL